MKNRSLVYSEMHILPKENKPDTLVFLASLSKEELDKELQKGIDSLKNERSYTTEEVDVFFMKKYGI